MGEWYPDLLDERTGQLTTSVAKPYWQEGWVRQHDRLAESLGANRNRRPLVVSGDLHAIAVGEISRAGSLDLSANPITTVLSGPIGTAPAGFPSIVRGVGASPSTHVDLVEAVAPLEQHGFTLIDFLQDRMVLRLFRWDADRDPLVAIDSLEPFYTAEL